MTFPQVYWLYDYWAEFPPEHELVRMGIAAYTTWKPAVNISDPLAHRKSLEARWKAGYLNVKQMFESAVGTANFQLATYDRATFPGIGPFPGAS